MTEKGWRFLKILIRRKNAHPRWCDLPILVMLDFVWPIFWSREFQVNLSYPDEWWRSWRKGERKFWRFSEVAAGAYFYLDIGPLEFRTTWSRMVLDLAYISCYRHDVGRD